MACMIRKKFLLVERTYISESPSTNPSLKDRSSLGFPNFCNIIPWYIFLVEITALEKSANFKLPASCLVVLLLQYSITYCTNGPRVAAGVEHGFYLLFSGIFSYLTESTAGSSHEVDLFGQSLIGDLLDVPVSVPTETLTANSNSSDVDLFADATFVSAPSNTEAGVNLKPRSCS